MGAFQVGLQETHLEHGQIQSCREFALHRPPTTATVTNLLLAFAPEPHSSLKYMIVRVGLPIRACQLIIRDWLVPTWHSLKGLKSTKKELEAGRSSLEIAGGDRGYNIPTWGIPEKISRIQIATSPQKGPSDTPM